MKNNTEYRNIWVWMETEHGYTQKVGFELLEKAKEEHQKRLKGGKYECPIPKGVKPRIISTKK